MADTALVSIAKVVKPHGLKGELSVVFYADTPFLLDEVPFVLLRSKDLFRGRAQRPRKFRVKSWRPHRDRILITLEDLDGRDKAQDWAGADMLVRERDLPEPDEDELLLHQLLDMRIYVLEQGEERYLGRVEDILTPQPEQEVWVIRTDDGQEVLFPAHEDTVDEVDLEQGRAVILPPPGLLELYLDPEGDPDQETAADEEDRPA